MQQRRVCQVGVGRHAHSNTISEVWHYASLLHKKNDVFSKLRFGKYEYMHV